MTQPDRRLPAWRVMTAALLFACTPLPAGATEGPSEAFAESVAQLRHVVGSWNVTTTQYKDDGTVAQKVDGSYHFDWIVPDRVLTGRSSIPSLGQASGILFYVNERRSTIEMVSVGADGHLWVMTGPAGGETRSTPPTAMSDGSRMQLRFTRFNVAPNRFESRMEVSTDGGTNWKPGNHQLFVRGAAAGEGSAGGLRYRKRTQPYIPLT